MKGIFSQLITRLLPGSRFTKNHYYPRLQYYEHLLSKYRNIQAYHTLLNEAIKRDSLRTPTKIAFYEDFPFGCSPEEIKRTLGKPNYQINVKTVFNNLILFYRLTLGGYRVKCELHFHNKKLFHFNYTFSHLGSGDKKILFSIIQEKYKLNSQDDLEHSHIIDPASNIMVVHDHVYLSIDYFNPGSDVLCQSRELVLLSEEQEKEKAKRNEVELISRL